MKKIVLTGLAILLALSLSTCDMPPINANVTGDTGVEFAQYSPDGNSITINLNGGGRSLNMDRALTNALAQINHDYYEVVFYYDDDSTAGATHTAPNIARTSWSRGEGAALSVYRGGGTAGINYGSVDYSASVKSGSPNATPDTGAAILLVGKKESGRYVLLAMGKLVSSINNDGTAGTGTIITSQTSKVTFEIVTLASAIHPDKANLSTKSSFYTIPDSTNGSYVFGTAPSYTGAAAIDATSTAGNPGGGTNFVEQLFNNVKFPLFMLESKQGAKCTTTTPGSCTESCCGWVPAADCTGCTLGSPCPTASGPCSEPCCAPPLTDCDSCTIVAADKKYYAAKFTFTTATASGTTTSGHTITDYVAGIVAATPAAHQYVDDKVPAAVIINGEKIPAIVTENLGVTVEMKNNNDDTGGTGDTGKPINPEAYFIITVPANKGGMIAFNFNIPVYGIIDRISNNGIQPLLWLIQPGLERFYVDNGIGLGGSILLGLGDPTKITFTTGFVQ